MSAEPEGSSPEPFRPFERLASERIYDSRWCGLRKDWIRLHDGHEQDYHVFEVDDAVVVVPVYENGDIALLWQYRYVHGKSHWEVPAGRIAPGEAPEAAAARELAEEAGCVARELVRLPGFYPINGISPHYAHAFVALGCTPNDGARPERSEQILVQRCAAHTVRERLRRGEIADGFTALALLYYFAGAHARP
ncbi:MAG: NUDIX domain-containing protein [Planctomycetes bacterium]|nr:NUDIX domain-containing protein [Planctomycetota bacterium]